MSATLQLLKTQAYINGQWCTAESEKTFKVNNPFDGSHIADVPDMVTAECEVAIDAASEAFPIWSGFTASKRSRILKKWHQLQLEHVNELAHILTLEQGKPLAEAIEEIKYGASYVEWFAEEARRIYGDVIAGQSRDKRITVIKQPIGVVGAITPWNFPSAMITRKVSPALAAGCTVVIKPSELTPLSALALAELAQQAGFPPGVLNVITSNDAASIAQCLTSDKRVRKLSFTGSTRVGKLLLGQSAETVKRVSLELGGNAPFIVFEDADLDAAVEGAMASKFRNAGQTCVCSNRLFVHSAVYDAFLEKLTAQLATLKMGNGLEKEVNVGPLINEGAMSKCRDLLNDAREKGGVLCTGGVNAGSNERFISPTLIADAHPEMHVFKEEIFGPIAPMFKFETEEEVIRMANNTDYGLAAYFFGRDHARLWRVAEALEYGMVGINTGMLSTPVAPFGGIKQSGMGREGSKYGIDDYLNIKYMCWGGIE